MDSSDKRIYTLTSPIFIELKMQGIIPGEPKLVKKTASGFFFGVARSDESREDLLTVKSIWYVTNRHVLAPHYISHLQSIKIKLRKPINDNTLVWMDLDLSPTELVARAKFPDSPEVDVAAIDLTDRVMGILKSADGSLAFNLISFQDAAGYAGLEYGVGDDVLVIGYPKGFYDSVNLFPAVKSGVICSIFGMNYEGNPCFLIDATLFPGSSGSIVISKPSQLGYLAGTLRHRSTGKGFQFLGVYSGEAEFKDVIGTSTIKSGFGLGRVWYPHNIDEVIENGIDAIQYRGKYPANSSDRDFAEESSQDGLPELSNSQFKSQKQGNIDRSSKMVEQ